ncbi:MULTISPECIES: hypothetical protein [unclassified Pseudomonas]|uniref:hypothetical protein n=1 Tax=unclassified Pseudomonas TaxID=196821 RepID=UPI00244D776A|nr:MULTISPECIES: hypothetical protein [unclassified Pseudomonas]MDG9928555.1 hypothetical protein [Pseudomonas sp. GD04042]MDH0482725.1 hypothetical protein [Pseudomonas sp. GD04015]MDH0604573.1 hypothetical protein [Pseudomonas sp. GD03869]
MDLRGLEHKRLSVSRWLVAFRDEHAWRWAAEEHYPYLRDRANELLQLGDISTDVRNQVVLQAFDRYQFYLRHREEAERTFCWHYEYEVLEGDQLVATTGGGGHLFATGSRQLLGCIGHHGPEADLRVTRWVDFTETHVGFLRGLDIVRPAGPAWRLRLSRRSPPPKRWAGTPSEGVI